MGVLFEKLYEFNSSVFYVVGVVLSLSMAICSFIYRVYLAKTVALILEAKKIENVKTWKIVTFLFGIIVAGICFVINFKVGKKITDNRIKNLIKKYIINAVAFGLAAIAISLVYENFAEKQSLYYEKTQIEYYHTAYLEDDHYVCYDKMGNSYKYDAVYDDSFKFYDKDGISYNRNDDYDYDSHGLTNIIRYENGYIDENGYLVSKKNLKKYNFYDEEYMEDDVLFYYDNDKNIYFSPELCSWDENGNLIFNKKELQDFDFNSFKTK